MSGGRVVAALVTVSALALGAGCGDGDDDGSVAASTAIADVPRKSVDTGHGTLGEPLTRNDNRSTLSQDAGAASSASSADISRSSGSAAAAVEANVGTFHSRARTEYGFGCADAWTSRGTDPFLMLSSKYRAFIFAGYVTDDSGRDIPVVGYNADVKDGDRIAFDWDSAARLCAMNARPAPPG